MAEKTEDTVSSPAEQGDGQFEEELMGFIEGFANQFPKTGRGLTYQKVKDRIQVFLSTIRGPAGKRAFLHLLDLDLRGLLDTKGKNEGSEGGFEQGKLDELNEGFFQKMREIRDAVLRALDATEATEDQGSNP